MCQEHKVCVQIPCSACGIRPAVQGSCPSKKLHQFLAPRSPSGDRGVFLCKKTAMAAARCPVQQPFSIILKMFCIFRGLALSVNACRPCQIPPFVAARHLPPERGKSFLKGGAFGSPRKLHLFAKASPFGRGGFAEQRRRGRGC